MQPTAHDVFLDCCPEAELYEQGIDFEGVIVEKDYSLAAYGYEGEDASVSMSAAEASSGRAFSYSRRFYLVAAVGCAALAQIFK